MEILIAFGHLLSRSASLAVGYMGTTALAVFAGVLVFAVSAAYALRRGVPLRQQWAGTVGVALAASVTVWLVVFGWAVIRTVYLDHTQMRSEITSLRAASFQQLAMKIGGVIIAEVDHTDVRLQLTVTAFNQGKPTTAHGWRLILNTSGQSLQLHFTFGQPPLRGSLVVRALDEQMQSPMATGSEVYGLLNFILPNTAQSVVERWFRDDPNCELVLSAVDQYGRECITRRNTQEMAREKFTRVRNK